MVYFSFVVFLLLAFLFAHLLACVLPYDMVNEDVNIHLYSPHIYLFIYIIISTN